MKTCGNCVYWTGRPKDSETAKCSLYAHDVSGLGSGPKITAVDAIACEHWRLSTKKYAREAKKPNMGRCHECIYWMGGEGDMVAKCKLNEDDPKKKDALYNRMHQVCQRKRSRREEDGKQAV